MTSPRGDVFRASLKRCLSTPDFLHEVREKFRNTDFPRQTRVLADWRQSLGPGIEHLRSAY